KVAVRIDEADADHLTEGFAAHRAGIHAQGAADVAGDSFEPLEAADLGIARRVGELLLLHPDTGVNLAVFDFDLLELTAGEMNDHTANAAVAHEQVRAAAHDEEGNLIQRAETHETGESLFGFGFGPKLRRATNSHGGVLGERFVKLDRPVAHHG